MRAMGRKVRRRIIFTSSGRRLFPGGPCCTQWRHRGRFRSWTGRGSPGRCLSHSPTRDLLRQQTARLFGRPFRCYPPGRRRPDGSTFVVDTIPRFPVALVFLVREGTLWSPRRCQFVTLCDGTPVLWSSCRVIWPMREVRCPRPSAAQNHGLGLRGVWVSNGQSWVEDSFRPDPCRRERHRRDRPRHSCGEMRDVMVHGRADGKSLASGPWGRREVERRLQLPFHAVVHHQVHRRDPGREGEFGV